MEGRILVDVVLLGLARSQMCTWRKRQASRAAPAAWGTSVVRLFGQAAGATGLSLRVAAAAWLTARAAHVVGHHHASCYPGAEILTLKLVYEVGTGRVLGAQAAGGAGIEKRLDIVATLLHFRGTVHDFAGLDLAYAPPFSAAKDPVHMVAFVAQNDLDGFARLVQPGDDLSVVWLVDVRDSAEAAASPPIGAGRPYRFRWPNCGSD